MKVVNWSTSRAVGAQLAKEVTLEWRLSRGDAREEETKKSRRARLWWVSSISMVIARFLGCVVARKDGLALAWSNYERFDLE